MPSASSGVIGRTWATVPSRRTTSASHSTGAPADCAETRSIAPVSSLSSPPSMGSSCHARLRDPGRWESGRMEFTEVVRSRRMVRRYDPDRPVPRELVERCLANAVRSPSAGFSQGWDFLVLTTQAEREAFWAATTEPDAAGDSWLDGIRAAPVLVLCLSHKDAYLDRYAAPDKGWTDRDEARWPVPYWDVDTGMASLLMLLTAVDEGLAACFFGVPPDRIAGFREAFGVPAGYTPIGCVSVGYAGTEDKRSPSLRRGRRGLEEVVH